MAPALLVRQVPQIVLSELSACLLPLVQASVQLVRWRAASSLASHSQRLGPDCLAVAVDASINLEHIRLFKIHAELWHEVEVDLANARRKVLHPLDKQIGPPQKLRIARHQHGDFIQRPLAMLSHELLCLEEFASSPHLEVLLALVARVGRHVPHAPRSVHEYDAPVHPSHARCGHDLWHGGRLHLLQVKPLRWDRLHLIWLHAPHRGPPDDTPLDCQHLLRGLSHPIWLEELEAGTVSHRYSPVAVSHSQLPPAQSVPTFFALISAC
eukprot:scaffold90309_cov63-Phaeocystis_antarctica.AAC.3